MRFRISLLTVLASVLVGMLVLGSPCSGVMPIPPPPYVPKSPAEDIVSFEAYITQGTPSVLHLAVTFAEATPPAGQVIVILVTNLVGSTEVVIYQYEYNGPPKITHSFDRMFSGPTADIALYAMLGILATDREPKTGFFHVTFNQGGFYSAVGGVVLPTNALIVLAPYLTVIGLVAATAAVAVKRKRVY